MNPRDEYTSRLESRKRDASSFEPKDRLFANTRLAVAAVWLVALWLTYKSGLPGASLLLGSIGLFALFVFLHGRVIRRRERCERAAAFYERGIARLDHAWAGGGQNGERFRDEAHLFSDDLDLFGKGSLFELLCTARTRTGEATLARWLLQPAPVAEARGRQAAVAELRGRLDLREELAILGESAKAGIDSDGLADWSRATPVISSGGVFIAAAAISVLVLGSFIGWIALGIGAKPFLVACAIRVLFSVALGRRFATIARNIEGRGRDLTLLSALLERLERETFASPRLAALRQALGTGGVPASRRIARLGMLISLLDARANQLFVPPYYALLIGEMTACAVERWRLEHGPAVAAWVAALGEIETLSALAGYSFEHPDDPFPEFVEGPPRFDGDQLGHPLLPPARCVRNDVKLGDVRVLVVSGSNMSGKSTLLRTVGVNIVLAFAGAPVCGAKLRLSPLALGASIRRNDSLQEGTSRFYAEITRLQQLMKLGESTPLCFLVDEILSGTNSHDRAIGAEGVIRGFVKRNAVGLVTTHDLSLAKVADALAPQGANVHFADHVEHGRISFDYRLREGVVTKSNALELMRAVGLDV